MPQAGERPDGEDVQLSLFSAYDDAQKEKNRRVDRAMDEIRSRFGTDKLVRGTTCGAHLTVGKKHSAQIEEMGKNEK